MTGRSQENLHYWGILSGAQGIATHRWNHSIQYPDVEPRERHHLRCTSTSLSFGATGRHSPLFPRTCNVSANPVGISQVLDLGSLLQCIAVHTLGDLCLIFLVTLTGWIGSIRHATRKKVGCLRWKKRSPSCIVDPGGGKPAGSLEMTKCKIFDSNK